MESRTQKARRIRLQRQRAGTAAVLVILLIAGIVFATCTGGAPSSTPARAASDVGATKEKPAGPASIEAGVESWQLGSAQSRQTVVTNGTRLTVIGGVDPSGASLSTVSTIAPTTGAIESAAGLASPVHDAASATFGGTTYLFGGGSPNTVATVQSVVTPSIPSASGSELLRGSSPNPVRT